MVAWMSDVRLVFLIWFVSIAVAVAAVLVFVEIRFKKKKEREEAARREKSPLDRMKIILNKEVGVEAKFKIVGKTAKHYFKEEYGMSSDLDYSELAKRFEKRGKVLEAEFCKKMFELYYSNKKITEKGIEDLGKMLIEMGRRKKVSKDISKAPSVWDRIDRVFGRNKNVVMGKLREYVVSLREKRDRKTRTKAREDYELLSWVKKAIRIGHGKKKLFSLLKDGGKSNRETKKILKIYDIESSRASKKKSSARLYVGEGGVAQRVIQAEKDRLEGSF